MNLNKLIEKFKAKKRILFTTPSHNQGEFIAPRNKKLLGEKIFQADYSEIEDFDNLADPQGIILRSQLNASTIYESKYTFYLTNGSTSGIIASMLAILEQNDKVLIARNCHKCVYNALVLTGAYPIWLMPDFNEEWGIFKPIKAEQVEKKLMQDESIKALVITNPSYEGAISNIQKISDVCKKYNVKLIVDEAHGSLWSFDGSIGTPAIYEGADISVQSLHKTAGALNPSAVLHINKESSIGVERIQESLNILNTTSPSYPILANIEATIDFLNSKKGKKKIFELTNALVKFKKSLQKYNNIEIFSSNNDITKILIKIEGISGYALSSILFNKYKIEDELSNNLSVLFLTGIGTTQKKLDKLKKALIKISKKVSEGKFKSEDDYKKSPTYPAPQVVFSPRRVYSQSYKLLKPQEAIGGISQELIISYPPGIPILIPGEVIKEEHSELLSDYYNLKVLQT